MVPDFEITLTAKSLSFKYSKSLDTYIEDILCPANNISGFFFSKDFDKKSIPAFAPRYDPPIPITTKTS